MSSKISARIGLGALAAAVLGAASLGGGASYMAMLQDRQSDLGFRTAAASGMTQITGELNAQTSAFAGREGVFEALASRHTDPVKAQEWLGSNLGGPLTQDGAVDFAAVFDAGYAPVYAWEPCTQGQSNLAVLDGRFLKSVTPHLAVQPDGTFAPVNAYALLGGKPVLYSFARIMPQDPGPEGGAAKADFLMTGRYVNHDLLAATGRNRSLEDLRFAPLADGRGVVLADGGGKPVGQLRWNDKYPGTEALRQAAAPLIACAALLLGIGGFAGFGAMRQARRLEASEAQARADVLAARAAQQAMADAAGRAAVTAAAIQGVLKPLADLRTSAFLLGRKLVNRGLGVEQQLERIERDIGQCETIAAAAADCHLAAAGQLATTGIDSWLAGLIEDEAAKLDPAVEVVCELGLGPLAADVDQAALRRVIGNLLGRAADDALSTTGRSGETPRVVVVSRSVTQGFEIGVGSNAPQPEPAAVPPGEDLRLTAARHVLSLQGGRLVITAGAAGGVEYAAALPLASAAAAGVKSAA